MSKIILHAAEPAVVTWPAPRTMRALTHGGLGQLGGDAVTADLAENEARRIEVARSMPIERAVENMVRSGHDSSFAKKWCSALIGGGETDATALGMIRQKAYPGGGDQSAADHTVLPERRSFRDAWRKRGARVVVDMVAARRIFASRLITAKAGQLRELEHAIELDKLLAAGAGDAEESFQALQALNLRAIGDRIVKARTTDDLAALWPEVLGAWR